MRQQPPIFPGMAPSCVPCSHLPLEKKHKSDPHSHTFLLVNMCSYFSGRKFPVTHLYFDPVKYPPHHLAGSTTSTKGKGAVSLADLKRDIKGSAFDTGCTLCNNGGGSGVIVFGALFLAAARVFTMKTILTSATHHSSPLTGTREKRTCKATQMSRTGKRRVPFPF